MHIYQISNTYKCICISNTVISPNFVMKKFCGKAHIPRCFRRIARNSAEIVPLQKDSTPKN